MAQPTIPGTGVGRPQMPYGSDGSAWYAIRLDNEGRIQVAMTFLPHASDHEDGGSDEIDVTALSGLLADDQHVLDAEVLAVAAALVHAARHENTGNDEISVVDLSGLLADDQHVLDAEVLAVAAALVHKARHVSGGADPFASTDLLEAIVKRLQVTGPVTLLLGAVADGEYLKRDGTAVVGDTPAGGAGLYSDYIHIRDEKAANTHGGTFTLGDWRTRDLNIELSDTGGDADLANNQITLEAGTYRCRICCPCVYVERNKARLQNITDTATEIVGASTYAHPSGDLGNNAFVMGRFTLAAQKVLEVQHRCQATVGSFGLGHSCNFGVVEVYTEVELWKEA